MRFVQEVGRVLRCYPNKELAYIIDPHDLFGVHCLSNPEKLGEVLSREEKEYEDELVKLCPEEQDREIIREMPPAKAFEAMDSYVSTLLSVLRSSGICDPPRKWVDDHWRGGVPTRKQTMTIQKVRWSSRYLPEDVRVPFKLILDQCHTYNKGTVNDLLTILFGLAKSSKSARKRKQHYFLPSIRYPKPRFAIQKLLFVMESN